MSFDIDLAESCDLCSFKKCTRFAGKKAKAVFAALEEMLPVVIVDKLGCVAIRFES